MQNASGQGTTLETRRRVLEALRDGGPLQPVELAERARLSRSTLASAISDLEGKFLIKDGSSGRTVYRSKGDRGCVAGVVFGFNHLRVALYDLNYDPERQLAPRGKLPQVRRLQLRAMDPTEALSEAARMIARLLDGASPNAGKLAGAGLGLPAPIRHGEVASDDILPGWGGVDPAEELRRALIDEVPQDRLVNADLAVEVDNDANCGALGEALRGAGRGYSHVLYIKAGTGIGGGLVVDGQLYRGADGTALEPGHVSVPGALEKLHYCGHTGCLEAIAGADAVINAVREKVGTYLSFDEIIDKAQPRFDTSSADAEVGRICLSELQKACEQIGYGCGNMCNLLAPSCVVLGGALAKAGRLALGPLTQTLQRLVVSSQPTVRLGDLGKSAEVLGACALAVRSHNFPLRALLAA